MTQYLQGVAGDTPLQAGLAFLPATIAAFAAATAASRLIRRTSNALVSVAGCPAMLIGTAWISRLAALALLVTLLARPRKQRILPTRVGTALRLGSTQNPGHRGAAALRETRPPPEQSLKENTMQITRNSLETNQGPSDWFTGTVLIDTVAVPAATARTGAALVHFTPGARTAWHTHPYGQTIYVTEGIGRCQRGGGPVEEIRPGDRVYFEPGENHWHGAAPNRFMTHIAIQEADETGSPVTWGEHVTDEQYTAAPAP